MIAALRTVAPGIGASTLSFLQEPQRPPIQTVLTTLLNDLGDLASDMVLVLDDYHVIDAREVQDGMAFLLDHLPPRLHLVIASRADPALPLARLRAGGELVETRAAELRFTAVHTGARLNLWHYVRMHADAQISRSLPPPDQVDLAVEVFRMLADPTRVNLLWLLLDGESSVNDLAAAAGKSQTGVSQHLAKLRMARLVQTRRQGNQVFYRVESDHVRQLVQDAVHHAEHASGGVPDHHRRAGTTENVTDLDTAASSGGSGPRGSR